MRRKELLKLLAFLLVIVIALQIFNIYLTPSEDSLFYIAPIKEIMSGEKEIIQVEVQNSFVDAAKKAKDSVVFIATNLASGSGVIVDEDGFILTNNHVIDGAANISVRLLDNRIFRAELIGADPKVDLAVLKINGDNLKAIEFGNSDEIQVGESVLAIGNPLGLDFTVTTGIISAKHRDRGPTEFRDFLQTDADINPGNSGGALVDLDGRLIGITTFIVSDERAGELGFAIPSNLANNILQQLIEFGGVSRGFLGVSVRNIVEIEDGSGVIKPGSQIMFIEENGPADKAGLELDDIIIALNKISIDSSNQLRNEIAILQPGSLVNVTVLRKNSTRIFEVELGLRPENLR